MPTITFKIKYSTSFGQRLFICGNTTELGNNNNGEAVLMQYLDSKTWQITIDVEKKKTFEYYYFVSDENNGLITQEWKTRSLSTGEVSDSILVLDTWSSPATIDYTFDTQAFDHLLNISKGKKKKRKANLTFCIDVALFNNEECIGILGGHDLLNNWDEKAVLLLEKTGKISWQIDIEATHLPSSFEYKYVIYNKKTKQLQHWEFGENRYLRMDSTASNVIVNDECFNRNMDGAWKGAGVAIPVFSLRSENSMGVGEFLDLKLLADWSEQTGMKLLQILPINDTTANYNWIDSYPYAAVSVFALHPMYLNLDALPFKRTKVLNDKIAKAKKSLNKLQIKVDYEGVMQHKLMIARSIFDKNEKAFLADTEFQKYFKKNKAWLVPYAAFCYLRDANKTPDFSQWTRHNIYNKKEITALSHTDSPAYSDIAFTYFLQYYLHVQLKEAVDYAHSKGIIVKGDIPIGIYRHSADAWYAPELYNMDKQAGAPPDDFSVMGQNWGFPTYNWERMAEDGYQWWQQRFTLLAEYFDAFRIDHILGFFRIWQIPMDFVQGIMGYFEPAIPLTAEEIGRFGIPFDTQRYCEPYITEGVLEELFGKDAEMVQAEYLQAQEGGRFVLKDHVATQQKIKALGEKGTINDTLRDKLYDLTTNILFIEVETETGKGYHPRSLFKLTTSFQHQPTYMQYRLQEVYNFYFYQKQEDFWEIKGREKLPAMKRATNMLVCGEDLGMVPACVPGVMRDLSILSLEVQRMPKAEKTTFFHPKNAPYLSVVTASSHDTSTVRGWWEENRTLTQLYYNTILDKVGEAPETCTPAITEAIVDQHLQSPGMWCILPIQDYIGIDEDLRWDNPHDERINVPAIIPHYWRWRMHISLEDLIKEEKFNAYLKTMVQTSDR